MTIFQSFYPHSEYFSEVTGLWIWYNWKPSRALPKTWFLPFILFQTFCFLFVSDFFDHPVHIHENKINSFRLRDFAFKYNDYLTWTPIINLQLLFHKYVGDVNRIREIVMQNNWIIFKRVQLSIRPSCPVRDLNQATIFNVSRVNYFKTRKVIFAFH